MQNKTMTSRIDSDMRESKVKHTKAFVCRSHEGLKKELQNLDSEYSKALSSIHRDLEETRDALKALRVSQKQMKRHSISGHIIHRQGMDLVPSSAVPVPTLPLQRQRRSSTIPSESNNSFTLVERRRHSEVTVQPQQRLRKIPGMTLDEGGGDIKTKKDERKSQISMKGGKTSLKTEELKINQFEERQSKLSDVTNTVSTISSSPDCIEVDGDLETNMEEVQGELGIKIAEGMETSVAESLGTTIAVVRGDLGTKMTETAGDSKVEEILGEKVADDRGDLKTSMLTVDQAKEPGNESESSSPGNEDIPEPVAVPETSVQQVLIHSWTNDDASYTDKANITHEKSDSLNSPRKRIRRASSPNIMYTTPSTEPVLNKPKTSFSGHKYSLTSIQELTHGNSTIASPRRRILSRRASSPDLTLTRTQTKPVLGKPKTGFSGRRTSLTSIQELTHSSTSNNSPRKRTSTRRASLPDLMYTITDKTKPVRCLPELNGTSPGFEKHRSGSIQENPIQESLRKINRRMNAPLTGAQLEKRLQAHRLDAISAGLQTKVACKPEGKAPNELDMNDLKDCRYLRRRVSK